MRIAQVLYVPDIFYNSIHPRRYNILGYRDAEG